MNTDQISVDLFGNIGILYPSDGFGGAVGIATASPTSAAGTSTYTATTATDSVFNTSSITPALVPGCLITTDSGYYAAVQSFTAGVGGIITVKRWLHKDHALIGGIPATGVAKFSLYTNPVVGTVKTCILARVTAVLLETVHAYNTTAAATMQLRDAAGFALLPNTGFGWPNATPPGTLHFGVSGRRFHGLLGFQLSNATTINVNAMLRPIKYDRS